jgi:hypothetical protein
MPYIITEKRARLNPILSELAHELTASGEYYEGDLNYTISYLLNHLINNNKNYANVNRIVGSLECAKIEFYRRVAAPYEDTKIQENGDVYKET